MSEAQGEGYLIVDYGLLCEVITRDEEANEENPALEQFTQCTSLFY